MAVQVKLLNGSAVVAVGTISSMGDVAGVVHVDTPDGPYLAWDLERSGDEFIATSYKRQ